MWNFMNLVNRKAVTVVPSAKIINDASKIFQFQDSSISVLSAIIFGWLLYLLWLLNI